MPGVLISIESLYIVQIWHAKWPLKFSEHLGSDASLPGNPLGGFIDVSGLLFQDGPNVKRKGTILLYIYIYHISILYLGWWVNMVKQETFIINIPSTILFQLLIDSKMQIIYYIPPRTSTQCSVSRSCSCLVMVWCHTMKNSGWSLYSPPVYAWYDFSINHIFLRGMNGWWRSEISHRNWCSEVSADSPNHKWWRPPSR